MIPKILHQTNSAPMEWEEKLLIHRARSLMPDWRYEFWDSARNLELVKKILPHRVETYLQLPHDVIRADIARCLFLYLHGGIYFDTDYKFYKCFPEELQTKICVLGIEEEQNKLLNGPKYGNAFLSSAAGFELWKDFAESTFERFIANGADNIVFLSGPHALTLFLREHPEYSQHVTSEPPEVIFPYFKWGKISVHRTPDTIGAHLCWGSWRHKGRIQSFRNRARRAISALLP